MKVKITPLGNNNLKRAKTSQDIPEIQN